MGQIYFYNDKEQEILKAIKEARDLVDVLKDLDKIEGEEKRDRKSVV